MKFGAWQRRWLRGRLLLLVPGVVLGLLAPAGAAGAGSQVAAHPTSQAAAGELLDINTASEAQLRALPGMGAAYARRVIEGRPYTAKNQLVTRGVLPQAAYDQIRDRIVAHRVASP